jgi:predicted dehydrogenase
MCDQEDLDLVNTAAPWDFHVPVCTNSLKTGKHAATEFHGALILEECWKVVECAEKFQKHCVTSVNL